jgi:alkylated DNA repair dioxygenase AlkB/glutathione S-transferase
LSASPGTNFSLAASMCIDGKKDLIFEKSWYSAFKDGRLVQVLRAKFVTGIYLCGALTNISIFATAMDAARHGYSITIVEDCLGYRSKPRHDEALRKLAELTGCEIIQSEDLIEELRRKAQRQQVPPRRNQRPPAQKNSGLENLMANLNLKPDANSSLPQATLSGGSSVNVAAETAGNLESPKAEENESSDLKLPPKPEVKRERVKSKIKTRRRHSKSIPKEGASASSGKDQPSPTSVTLQAATQALEKFSSAEEDSVIVSTRDMSPNDPKKGATKASSLKAANGISPDQSAGVEKGASAETGLTPLCEGDTIIITDLLDADLAKDVFEQVRDEVRWQKMSHQGGDVPRLVAVQGHVADDGSTPIYRHPADESPPLLPFTGTVSRIRAQVEKRLGHAVNHVLIQFYRDGTDYISEHSDKTLDIVPGTFIANVSLGAQRTMVFRTKKPLKSDLTSDSTSDPLPRQATRAPLPHNSMCKMGLVTNMRWLHGIRQDKRMRSEKSEEELAYDGGRISLTFRSIGTFLDNDHQKIWGQGAVAKTQEEARTVVNGDTSESERMIRAFGKENHSTEFDWGESYGEGFDVLHISNTSKLFLSGDPVVDTKVKILLAECGIPWVEGKLSPSFNWKSGNSHSAVSPIPESLPVKFIDNDLSKSTVVGDQAIMLYLNAVYRSNDIAKSQVDLARQFTRLQQCDEILKKWRAVPFRVKPFQRELELWEAFATEAQYIAGSSISLADYTLWPILYEIKNEWKNTQGLPNLLAYYHRMESRASVKKTINLERVTQESGHDLKVEQKIPEPE